MAKYDYWITDEGLIEIEGWARDGLTDKQISHNIGCAESTFNEWKKKFPELMESLKKGKEVVDRQVENALLKSALGYEYYEEAVTNTGEVVKVLKHSKPNTTAQIFWLKNRKTKEWRDRQDIEMSGELKTGKLDSILEQLEDD